MQRPTQLILINNLVLRVNIDGVARDWFIFNLTGRYQCVMIVSPSSNTISICHGLPRGGVRRPVMFKTYTTLIADICTKHLVLCHRFTDYIQLCEIRAWMLMYQLKLNKDRTEFSVMQASYNLRVCSSSQLRGTWTNHRGSEKPSLLFYEPDLCARLARSNPVGVNVL